MKEKSRKTKNCRFNWKNREPLWLNRFLNLKKNQKKNKKKNWNKMEQTSQICTKVKLEKIFTFVGENKIKEILLLDDMYKKFVLLALTGIKFQGRLSKTYLEKEKDLRFEREQLRRYIVHYRKSVERKLSKI